MPTKQDIAQIIEIFTLDCESRRLTAQTMQYYKAHLRRFAAWLETQGVRSLADLTANHLRTFLAEMARRDLAEDTQATAARVIRTFLNFAVREELLAVSPMAKVRMPRPSKRILPAFEPGEIEELLSACKDSRYEPRDRAVILVLLDSGLRVSELCALTIGDVDIREGVITVKMGKGKRDRLVFLGAKSKKAVLRYLLERENTEPTEPLWVSEDGGAGLTHWGVRMLLDRLATRAGVEDVSPHKFRRTFCLWSLRAGMDVVSLSRIMGHEDTSLIRRYAAQLTDDLRTAHAKHGAVDSMLADGKKRR